jgi:PAS domain S-box-containing protein
MRDEHRPKQELIHEITGLRKQIIDLKEAMTARRRVEDALRAAEALLRTLTDNAPVGLCLFRRDGTLLTSNRPFARMLGYDSAAELLRVGGVLGVFASTEEQARILGSTGNSRQGTVFRHKSGTRSSYEAIAVGCEDHKTAVLVVFECMSLPHRPTLHGA